MDAVLTDLLGARVTVQRFEFQPVVGFIRAVAHNANGFHFALQTINIDEVELRGFVLHECVVKVLPL